MSYLNTKQALVQQLLTATTIENVAFEGNSFDPSGKVFWFACYFSTATNESTGKTLDSSDQRYGFFQVSIFTSRKRATYDNLLLEKLDLIQSTFKNTTSISYNGQNVDILGTTTSNNRVEGAWLRRDITINYMTFSER